MTKAFTLRLPDDVYERLRQEGFNKRVSITSLILSAIERGRPGNGLGCDQCGRPITHITKMGFHFCELHGDRIPAGQERGSSGNE